MAGKSTYSAGTAFLTVVPSFLGIEQAFKQQVRDMAAAADKDLAAGMAKGLDDINRQAKDRGARAGKDYAGAYESEAKKSLTKAWQNLPEPKPEADMSQWDKDLARVRQGMKDLSRQRIGIDIDRETFDRAIDDFRKKLGQLRDTAAGPNKQVDFFNAGAAASDLKELQAFTEEAARRAGAGGDLAGSAFGQRMSKSLAAAIGQVPDVKVGADTSAAEAKLAELRTRMTDLQSKRIGVDIDAGAAYAEIKLISEELNKLDRRQVRADIRTNARAAAAELGQVVTAAEGAASATEGIGGSANFSLSRLETLVLLGASLGSVIVPAAAAAAGALGTIGTAAAASVVGIGVVALAISGVADAVKALNNYQAASAKSAKSFDDANRSMASSTDQVRSAQAALANTRRTTSQGAADAARQVAQAEQGVADARRQAAQASKDAAQQVVDARQSEKNAELDLVDARRQAIVDEASADRQVRDAQRALTSAEQDALDVRQKLNQAIEDAKNNMLELDAQLHRNELDQAKAVTAQMAALDALNKLKTNPRATEIELRQAQEAYDEQSVQLEQLGVKHKELAQQKAKYDKQGVEGDDQVVAARKRIKDADQAVADARERVGREEQQRQEAYYQAQRKVADAQQRVAKAQESVARAQQAQRDSEIRGQEQVAKAQQSVSDARRQQARQAQDAQYQLAQASQAVTAAQRAQQAAWDKTSVAGGSALDTLNAKMALLSPAQQHFAKFLFGLKNDFIGLRDAAAEPMLPQFETAITGLLKYLPALESFIGKVADKIGSIAVQAVRAFGNPVWQRFFGYINQTAVPSLQMMFDVGENLAQGLADIFLALTPFNKQVGTGLVDLSRDFAVWADKLDKTQGYRNFLQYVQENGPRVVHFLGEVGQLFIDLVKASAPLGSVVLRVLTVLVDVINSIPTPALTALVFAIGALSLGFSVLGGVMRAMKFKEQISEIFGPAVKKLVDDYAISTGRATDETGKFGKATAAMQGLAAAGRDKVTGFAGAIGGIARNAGTAASAIGSKLLKAGGSLVTMLGGPWGVALAGASLAVGYFTEKSQEQKAKVDTLASALNDLSTTYRDLAQSGDQAGASADDAFRKIVQQNPELQKAVIQLDHLGVSFNEMVKAAGSGDPSAVLRKLNAEIERTTQLSDAFDQRNAAARGIYGTNPYKGQIEGLKEVRDAFEQNAKVMGQASQATAILNADTERSQLITEAQTRSVRTGAGAQVDLINTYDRNAASIDVLNALVNTYNNLQSTSQQRADAARAAIEHETGAAIAQTDADENLAQQTGALRDQVNQAKAAHDKHAVSMSLSTQTGLRNRDALEGVAKSIRDMYIQDIAAGKPLADVTAAHNNRIKALQNEAHSLGLDQGETKKLITLYGDVPRDVKSIVEMDPKSFKNVYTNLQKLQFMQQMLKLGATADQAEKGWQQSNSDMNRAIAHGFAGGGRLVGPGTGTSDSFIARVSNGEWVHKADAVDYYGDSAMAAINNMQVPRENLAGYADGGKVIPRRRSGDDLPGYASGGKILRVPITENISKTWVPTADWVRAHTPIAGASDGAWKGTLSPNATVAKMQKFALNQRGKRYLWAAVGPNRYDCCIVAGVRIYGPDGVKPIEDVQAGDRVYSYVEGKLEPHTVTAAWKSIHQPVFKVRTRNRAVTASANHPFLRVVQTGTERVQKLEDAAWPGVIVGRYGNDECSVSTCTTRSRCNGMCLKHDARYKKYGNPLVAWESSRATFGTEWAQVDQLQLGDLLVQPRIMPTEPGLDPHLPDGTPVDQDVAWLIGAAVGDGTVTDQSLRLCLFGADRDRATRIILDRWCKKVTQGDIFGLIGTSVRLARALEAMGMRRPGHDKRVPEAVWSWEPALQRAFLDGYCDAGGSRPADTSRHGERTYQSASRQLIEDARALHLVLGDPVSNITVTKRTKPIVIKGTEVENALDQHAFTIWPRSTRAEGEARLRDAPGLAEWLDGSDFTVAPVLGIDPDGEQDTWDLNIEGAHNFIADGIVVHNSGLVGNLWALATGHSLYHRYMSTSDMGPGRHGMVAGPGRYFTVYLGPGHTAANVGGLHAEAFGGNGTPLAIGHIGTRLSYYNQRLHLPGFAEGGRVDPKDLKTKQDRMVAFLKYGWPEPPSGQGFDSLLNSPVVAGQFDSGGMLPPGYSTVVNNTGAPEPVLTGQQWQDISNLVRQVQSGRAGNTYQFSFLDTTLTPEKLRQVQDREAALARVDFPR
jgi:hypothetical protein